MTLSEQLQVLTNLADVDAMSTPGFEGDKDAAKAAMKAMSDELADLQERLFAESTQGGRKSLLVVLQGMDTSGKGGTIERLARAMSAHDLLVTSFKKPTEEELAHDFLWRIQKALPPAGKIAVFDRSHYEDVLVVRVHGLQPAEEIERRYGAINDFEKTFVDGGGTILKCVLHIDKDVQKQRLTERLEDPAKYWKHNPGDLKERAKWDEYAESYQLVLDRCSKVAPWHVVPSGHKWYRNWAVSALVLEALRGMDLQWPMPDFDVEAEKARVAAS
jgi:PPK2 family polyphosphate:nucleotide phosphotransferase